MTTPGASPASQLDRNASFRTDAAHLENEFYAGGTGHGLSVRLVCPAPCGASYRPSLPWFSLSSAGNVRVPRERSLERQERFCSADTRVLTRQHRKRILSTIPKFIQARTVG